MSQIYRRLPSIPEEEFDPVADDDEYFQPSQNSFGFSQSQSQSQTQPPQSQRPPSRQYNTPEGTTHYTRIFYVFVSYLSVCALFLFAVSCITIVSTVFMKPDTCPIMKREQVVTDVTASASKTSISPFFTPHSSKEVQVTAELFSNTESKGSFWIRKNWDRIKGLMNWIIYWIDDNCNLECVLAKLGIWVN